MTVDESEYQLAWEFSLFGQNIPLPVWEGLGVVGNKTNVDCPWMVHKHVLTCLMPLNYVYYHIELLPLLTKILCDVPRQTFACVNQIYLSESNFSLSQGDWQMVDRCPAVIMQVVIYHMQCLMESVSIIHILLQLHCYSFYTTAGLMQIYFAKSDLDCHFWWFDFFCIIAFNSYIYSYAISIYFFNYLSHHSPGAIKIKYDNTLENCGHMDMQILYTVMRYDSCIWVISFQGNGMKLLIINSL